MFKIVITHVPSLTSGDPTPFRLPEAADFVGFHTDRAGVPLYNGLGGNVRRYRKVRTWVTREAAERNLHHLIARGYTARIEVV